MPIKPEHKHHYGAAWREVRKAILLRANNRCECRSQCGDVHDSYLDGGLGDALTCSAPNDTQIVRLTRDPAKWREHHHNGNCAGETCQDSTFDGKVVWVILTVAHLNHTAGDDRQENLLALCQRCHLRLDREQHAATAAATRARKRLAQWRADHLDGLPF